MNLTRLASNIGKRFRLRPTATVANLNGGADPVDDLWRLVDVSSADIRLVNERSHQSLRLAPDNVHHYASNLAEPGCDGFLELSVYVDITPKEPRVDLIPSGVARTLPKEPTQPLQARLEALMNRINPEIMQTALSRRGSIAVMVGLRHLQLLNQLRSEPGFDELMVVKPNGNVCMGVGSRIGDHIHDLDEVGGLQGVVLSFPTSVWTRSSGPADPA